MYKQQRHTTFISTDVNYEYMPPAPLCSDYVQG
jgi:hypothetical protein